MAGPVAMADTVPSERLATVAGDADLRAAQRSLRDLAALLALPAMWLGHEPADIATDLLRVLVSILRLESAYVCFADPAGGPALERWRPVGPHLPGEFAPLLAQDLARDRGVVTMPVVAPAATTPIRVTSLVPTLPGEVGHVLVGAARTDFPTDRELHLLRVAVGQATIAIRLARLLLAERSARLAAEAALAQRNTFLATLAQEMMVPLTALVARATQAEALAITAGPSPAGAEARPADTSVTDVAVTIPQLSAIAGRLTRREAEVLGLLVQGLSNKQIAAALWVSDRTVERHITGLYRKLGVQRRPEAIALALRHTKGKADT